MSYVPSTYYKSAFTSSGKSGDKKRAQACRATAEPVGKRAKTNPSAKTAEPPAEHKALTLRLAKTLYEKHQSEKHNMELTKKLQALQRQQTQPATKPAATPGLILARAAPSQQPPTDDTQTEALKKQLQRIGKEAAYWQKQCQQEKQARKQLEHDLNQHFEHSAFNQVMAAAAKHKVPPSTLLPKHRRPLARLKIHPDEVRPQFKP